MLIFSYAFVVTLLHILRIPSNYYGVVCDAIMLITSLISLLIGYFTVKHFGVDSAQGKSILFITLAILFWFIGDTLWVLVFSEATVSVADVFYLVGYPLFGVGIYFGITTFYPALLNDPKKVIPASIVFLIVSLLYFRMVPVAWDGSVSMLENIVSNGYVLVDLVLLAAVISLAASTFTGMFNYPWMIVALGTAAFLSGDIYYAINQKAYQHGNLIDLAWYFGVLLYGVAFVMMKRRAERAFSMINGSR